MQYSVLIEAELVREIWETEFYLNSDQNPMPAVQSFVHHAVIEKLNHLEQVEQSANPGCKVTLTHRRFGQVILRNVTEIHYRHGRGASCAFETDIHGTGMNYEIADILEFATDLETEIAEHF